MNMARKATTLIDRFLETWIGKAAWGVAVVIFFYLAFWAFIWVCDWLGRHNILF